MNEIQYKNNCSNEFDFDQLLILLLILLNFRRYPYKYNLYNFKNTVKNSNGKNEMKADIVSDKQNQVNEKSKTVEKSKSDGESENNQLSSGEFLECLKCDEKKEMSVQNLPSVYENKKKVRQNNLFIKMPVVLAQRNISFILEPVYDFDEAVLEIKSVKEQAFLRETDLLILHEETSKVPSGKLFINGFIRKSIEYAALSGQNDKYAIGAVKNLIMNIPFSFTSLIEFDILPAENKNIYSEPIWCDIEKQHIYETEIYDNIEKSGNKLSIDTFRKVHEKMVINLDVKILQKQIVRIKG